jgi:urocanate hydratase
MSQTTTEHIVREAALIEDVDRQYAERADLSFLSRGLNVQQLPAAPLRRSSRVPHAPARKLELTSAEIKLALQNALRYFPPETHHVLAPEFLQELRDYGHIYMYRFRPREEEFFPSGNLVQNVRASPDEEDACLAMRAYPLERYPTRNRQAASIMLMIMNNLDPRVAQFPHELITYGSNGSVFSNWAQFRIMMQYLCRLGDDETLHVYSGHPLGIFPSHRDAPRVVVSNGLMVPSYSSHAMYERQYALGNSQYGNMTAGSYCYVGSQGIVAGTFTVLIAASRKYIGCERPDLAREMLRGKVFVTSGAGGMSGAQPKASVIAGCVCVVAEIARTAIEKRHKQGWVQEIIEYDLDTLVSRIVRAKHEARPVSIGFLGNIVDVWERLVTEHQKTGLMLADLGSDQTSLHIPFTGGYYPAGLSYEEANDMMVSQPERFKERVEESLRRQAAAINYLTEQGLSFWDYGNAFLLNAWKAGAKVARDPAHTPDNTAEDRIVFRYPSYVQDIMGDVFSLGFGPFRWICTSCHPEDLELTDRIAYQVLQKLYDECDVDDTANRVQLQDSIYWIQHAQENKLVVGSQARILYANGPARIAIALRFNEAIRDGQLRGSVVLSRDHHDVSGADSPWRETSNITDGSKFLADMSFHTVVGNASRGATWVALHDGGGVGISKSMNCGFGLVLDGTPEASQRAKMMLLFDVYNGITRRAWSGNHNAKATIAKGASDEGYGLKVTLVNDADEDAVEKALQSIKF